MRYAKNGLLSGMSFMLLAGAAALAQAQSSTYTQTQYPIILASGLGNPELEGIQDALEAGGATVCRAALTAYDSTAPLPLDVPPPLTPTAGRGQQLIGEIQACLLATGAEKVNIFGYSQGSLDARFALAFARDAIASVTSFAGPHRGSSELIDTLIAEATSPAACDVADPTPDPENCPASTLFGALTAVVVPTPGTPSFGNPANSTAFFSSAGLAQFNAAFPEGLRNSTNAEGCLTDDVNLFTGKTADGIGLYSMGGNRTNTSSFFNPDPTDPLLTGLEDFLLQGGFVELFDDSDGLVEVCSSHFGKVRRDNFRMNHLDFANQVGGNVTPIGTTPLAMYREHANYLKNQGF